MHLFAFILASLSFAAWMVLTFLRGGFWQIPRFDADITSAESPARWPKVMAVIPARNEAETIGQCIASLLAQDYPGVFEIIVVDDHSEDETGSIAAATAQRLGDMDRVTTLRATELQSGWTGKLWALHQGVEATKASTADYFLFTDADIVHAPDTLRRLVTRAERQQLDLASLMVLLQAKTIPERLLIPAFLYFFLMLYPPKWIASTTSRTAGAAGGCILLRKQALQRIGGIEAIRAEVIDDCALARAVKSSSGSIWMGLTRKSVSLRSYASFGEIRDLIARTAFTQLRYSSVLLLGTIVGMLLTHVVPVVLTFHPRTLVWGLSLAAWVLMTLTYLLAVRFYMLSPFGVLLLPVAAMFYSYATVLSAVRYWKGRGGQWKGRTQAPTVN